MADGSAYPLRGGRPLGTISSPLTAKILDFLTGYGAAGASFMASFYGLSQQEVSKRCTQLVDRGDIVRWFFDGNALYALPKDAPEDPEILNGKRQVFGRRKPRVYKKKGA